MHPLLAMIHHDGSPRYVSEPQPQLGSTVQLRLRVPLAAPVSAIFVRSTPDGEEAFAPLVPDAIVGGAQWWTVALTLTMPVVGYRFLIIADEQPYWYSAAGLTTHLPTDYHDFRLLAGYHAPGWVADAVFYQIFPDRFADGDPANNVRTDEWQYERHAVQARAWDEPPGATHPSFEFYGGDLQGITERLPYLAQLGVNALYLNPIFSAPSVHRYDVADYNQVDSHLGGAAALVALREALAAREMRLLLDIVPNHCGSGHAWFRAAQADPEAATAAYFSFTEHPHGYLSWLGVPSLPKLNYRSAALRDAMYHAPDSALRRWLQPPYSIDGWRVDVANMLGRNGADQLNLEIVREMRQAVKAENGESYLIGENFYDATAQLQGDGWDANMNYSGFTEPVWHWLAGQRVPDATLPGRTRTLSRLLSTEDLAQTWAAFRAPVPWVIVRQQFNLLGSHDTPRLRTLVGDAARQRLAVTLQLTYPGVPCIYYGDEIGLEGSNPTLARATMPWDQTRWDHDLREFYRALIRLRRTSPALRHGGFEVLLAQGETLAFLRDAPEEQVIVVVQRCASSEPVRLALAERGFTNGQHFSEVLSGATSSIEQGVLTLKTHSSATIWRSGATS